MNPLSAAAKGRAERQFRRLTQAQSRTFKSISAQLAEHPTAGRVAILLLLLDAYTYLLRARVHETTGRLALDVRGGLSGALRRLGARENDTVAIFRVQPGAAS